jgi:hypothetical protein
MLSLNTRTFPNFNKVEHMHKYNVADSLQFESQTCHPKKK